MATITNPDGTVEQVVIGQELAKTPKERKKREKKYDYERKIMSSLIRSEYVDQLVAEYGNPSKAITALVDSYFKAKQ
jgi:hypothetical protein